jgi:hypothetical protein
MTPMRVAVGAALLFVRFPSTTHGDVDWVTATVPVIVVDASETTHGDVDCVTATVPVIVVEVSVTGTVLVM